MRLNSLTVENLRVFAGKHTIPFDAHSGVSVLLGNNGAGKTTILTAIQKLLSEYTNAFPNQRRQMFSIDDVHMDEQGRYSDYLAAELSIGIEGREKDIVVSKYIAGLESKYKIPQGGTKEIYEYGSDLKVRYLNGEDVTFPIVAYYSTERGRIKAPERRRDFAKKFENYDAYTGALDAEANFRRFFEWFDLQTSIENEEKNNLTQTAKTKKEFEEARDFQLITLQAIRQALPQLLDGKYSNPRILMSPMRFVVDEHIGDSKREFRIEKLSDGYRILIAMVCDLVARMAEANPTKSVQEILDTPGVVLIDEIDLHLHPQMQRKIIHKLHNLFKNIQFIITTHSPLVALSAMDVAQILTMEDGGKINIDWNESMYQNYDVNQILLSPLFGIPSVRSEKWDDILDERKQLLQNKTKLNDEQKQKLKHLNEQILELESTEPIQQSELSILLQKLSTMV